MGKPTISTPEATGDLLVGLVLLRIFTDGLHKITVPCETKTDNEQTRASYLSNWLIDCQRA